LARLIRTLKNSSHFVLRHTTIEDDAYKLYKPRCEIEVRRNFCHCKSCNYLEIFSLHCRLTIFIKI